MYVLNENDFHMKLADLSFLLRTDFMAEWTIDGPSQDVREKEILLVDMKPMKTKHFNVAISIYGPLITYQFKGECMRENEEFKVVINLSHMSEAERKEFMALLLQKGIEVKSFLDEKLDRMRKAKDRKRAATGRAEGPPCYGACDSGCMITGHSGRCKHERWVLDMIIKFRQEKPPMSYAEIAKRLNQQGIHPRQAAKWTDMTVFNVLRSSEKEFLKRLNRGIIN